MNWKITRRKEQVMIMGTKQNSAVLKARQESDPEYGTLTEVMVVSENEYDCNLALAVLKSAYGDPDGTIKWGKDRTTLRCCWTFSFCSWNTRFEQDLGEKEVDAICNKHSLTDVSRHALYGVLKALEQSTAPNFDMLRAFVAQVNRLVTQRVEIAACAWEIRAAANKRYASH